MPKSSVGSEPSFLGIGFYSLPKLRRIHPLELSVVWVTWGLWTSGVTLRWLTNVYQWHWRALLPAVCGPGTRRLRDFLSHHFWPPPAALW